MHIDHKPYRERLAEWDAQQHARWEESGSDLSFDEWKREEFERLQAAEAARREAEDRAAAHARRVAGLVKQIPARYRAAETEHPDLHHWVRQLLAWTQEMRSTRRIVAVEGWHEEPRRDPLEPDIETACAGPSLLLLGPTGVGKSHAAFGALRRYVAEGGSATVKIAVAADAYAEMRPRSGVDSEDVFGRYAKTPVLFLDDLGAAKTSEWVEEINYRLVNYRYNHQLATLFTSNVPARQLGEYLGDRVASRLTEMCTVVVLKGNDRRRAA